MHTLRSLAPAALAEITTAQRAQPYMPAPIAALREHLSLHLRAVRRNEKPLDEQLTYALHTAPPHWETVEAKGERLEQLLANLSRGRLTVREEDRTFLRIAVGALAGNPSASYR